MTVPLHAPVTITVTGRICEEQGVHGHAVRVTVIQGGRSKNGYLYGEQILQEIARFLEGAQAYADHAHGEASMQVRSVRDIVGFYHDVQYVAPQLDQRYGRVDATLHILEVADWLWSLVREACELGRPDLIGLSIDITGYWELHESRQVREVTQVVALNSCDIVTRPSAGGALRRILHDMVSPADLQGEEISMEHQSHPDNLPHETIGQSSPDSVRITEQQEQLTQIVQDIQRERAQILLERRLQESILPEPMKAGLRDRFRGRCFEADELETELKAQQEMLAALADTGLIRGHTYEKARVEQMISEAEKVQAAFDRMFDLEIDRGKLGNIRAFDSIREAYTRVSGDATISSFQQSSTLGTMRVGESAPLASIREADITTASFGFLLGTSMNKRLLQDYLSWPSEWMKFVTVVPIRDFKQQSRVRVGAFGSLPLVAENNAYTAVALDDSAASYAAQKRGNLVNITREVILNDDLQAIRQLPSKLAAAAAYTLAEFVYNFLTTGTDIYDSEPLFTAADPHNNQAAGALSSTAVQSGITAIRKQRNSANKRLGLRPRYLVVPPELEWSSRVMVQSAQLPGSANNDINPLQGYLTPIVSPQLSDATQWYLIADPREVDTIELGFVGGQVNPALYIQDQPQFGTNFTHDVITYKIRHEYGGAVVDFRGFFRGN